ncbi:phosphotriesterase-related protein [Rhodococcus sp. ACPA4]|uniref:phosphotriesterase family protein n=1 Tax=Rhodococcus sp. ACPA4 TaxID=2028571 RepID=UPI000BB12E76|nr:phosphotriesterase [Rhodococcus sp. ACPA4]PBC43568.1 phosphotriesterase-related protein [Rhodococcus sp. ACPA4]
MAQVETVRGSIDTSALGRTYMHEHIFILNTEMQQNFPEEWGDEDDRVADAVAKLRALAAQGVQTIVDPTVVGLGRYIPRVQRIADQVPELNIVVATGCYTFTDVPFYFQHRGPALNAVMGAEVPDPMVDLFVKDITVGIADTGVRAALLKCAIDAEGLRPGVERVMRAVAKAHHLTGAPITVHTHPESKTALDVKRVMCDEEGVKPERIVLGHSGDSTDLDHLTELAESGFILGMDRFGLNVNVSFEERADTLVEMCRRGYAEQMVLSHDANCFFDWMDPALKDMMPGFDYLHIEKEVLPYVREQGVTEEQITAMLFEVPRRYFENVSTY